MNEVAALVKFNDENAIVLNKEINFRYQKQGNLIIGIDESETFIDCYYYEPSSFGFKAFGGEEFDITLEDGEVIHCNGQWWHGGFTRAGELINKEVVGVTYQNIEALKKCYVFSGCFATKDGLEKLTNEYIGKVYEYYEYEEELKKRFRERMGEDEFPYNNSFRNSSSI